MGQNIWSGPPNILEDKGPLLYCVNTEFRFWNFAAKESSLFYVVFLKFLSCFNFKIMILIILPILFKYYFKKAEIIWYNFVATSQKWLFCAVIGNSVEMKTSVSFHFSEIICCEYMYVWHLFYEI